VSAGHLQPKGGLMAQANWLGPEVGGHLALWAAFRALVTTVMSRIVLRAYGALEIVKVIIINTVKSCI